MGVAVITIFALFLVVGLYGYASQGDLLFVVNKLTPAEIASYAEGAGFHGADLITATAIALAESGGDPKAHGDTSLGSGQGSFGLWQVYSDAHPEYGPNFDQLYDPIINAQAAYNIFLQAGGSFQPWSTYKSGVYTAFNQKVYDSLGYSAS